MSTNSKSKAQKPSNSNGRSVVDLVHHLQNVNTKAPEAQQNKSSMRDADGNRVKFNEKGNPNRFRGIRGTEVASKGKKR